MYHDDLQEKSCTADLRQRELITRVHRKVGARGPSRQHAPVWAGSRASWRAGPLAQIYWLSEDKRHSLAEYNSQSHVSPRRVCWGPLCTLQCRVWGSFPCPTYYLSSGSTPRSQWQLCERGLFSHSAHGLSQSCFVHKESPGAAFCRRRQLEFYGLSSPSVNVW